MLRIFRWRDLKDWEEQEPHIIESLELLLVAVCLKSEMCLLRSGSKKVTLKTDSRGPCWCQLEHGCSMDVEPEAWYIMVVRVVRA